MKLPIIPAALSLVALVIAVTLALSPEDTVSAKERPMASVTAKKSHRKPKALQRIESPDLSNSDATVPAGEPLPDESASLASWNRQLQDLLASGETPENAAVIIAAAIDRTFIAWAETEISAAAALTGQERIDRLVLAGSRIEEGAATIYEHLNLVGGRAIGVAADALDAIAAEIQYAEVAPDHATRLALLRLIRERDHRIFEASAMPDESAKANALRELDHWYESRMGELAILRNDG